LDNKLVCWICGKETDKFSDNFQRGMCDPCEAKVGLILFEEIAKMKKAGGN